MRVRRADPWLLALLVGVAVWALATPLIWTRGEAREALVVRDIVRNAHWVIAYRDGTIASKPPLFHWLAASAVHVFGMHDWVLRLPSVVAALVMLAATRALGARMGRRALGTLAATILAAMPLFWRFALEARVDMVFSAAITVALLAFYTRDSDASHGSSTGFVLALVAAVLTKGPAGLILPLAIIAVYLVVERNPRELVTRWAVPAAAAVALAAVWYAAAYAVAGQHFVDIQLVHENLRRAVGGEDFERIHHRQVNLPAAFAATLLPWNLAIVWGVWRRWQGHREDRAGHFLHVWWIVVFGLFALTPRTRTVYLLPLYPAIALLAARALLPWASRVLPTAILALAVVILAVTQADRLAEARRVPLRAFAAKIAPRLPAGTTLRAAPLLGENDVLVLRWMLDRSIVRGRLACRPDELVLASGASFEKARALGFDVVDQTGSGDTAIGLLTCARGGAADPADAAPTPARDPTPDDEDDD
jgi:4-amino-4-deoxy-L-arabinose transferase-like glycosyltransferase